MKKFVFILSLVFAVLLAACSDRKADGTADAGGGEIEKSTEADVRKAVAQAYSVIVGDQFFEKLRDSKQTQDLLAATKSQHGLWDILMVFSNPSSMQQLVMKDSPPPQTEEEIEAWTKAVLPTFEKYPSDDMKFYFKFSQIHLKEKGGCVALDKPSTDASISKFDLGATICVSIEKLKLLPKDSLPEHVTGILSHELAHMLGFDEEVAVFIQKAVTLSFQSIVGSSGAQIPRSINANLELMTIELRKMTALLESQVGSSKPEVLANAMMAGMGQALAYINATYPMLGEGWSPLSYFYLPETEDREQEIINNLIQIRDSLEPFLTASDETLVSSDFLLIVRQQRDLSEKIYERFNELMKFYDSNPENPQ